MVRKFTNALGEVSLRKQGAEPKLLRQRRKRTKGITMAKRWTYGNGILQSTALGNSVFQSGCPSCSLDNPSTCLSCGHEGEATRSQFLYAPINTDATKSGRLIAVAFVPWLWQ